MQHDLTPPLEELLGRFEEGTRVALARAISLVENERPGFQAFLHRVLTRGPQAQRVGLTGPPGAGKSSIVASLCQQWLRVGERVGIVAVDPTSPYSGGALLGDRIRMNELSTDPDIFIRSMATRGSLGGLATTTKEVVDLMDGFGMPRILIETVGVGQTELEITGAADTVVVVLVPESGDGIQAMKAGLMEIADIFVINKADRPGADRLLKELRMAIHLRMGDGTGPSDAAAGHHGPDLSGMGKRPEDREPKEIRRYEQPEGWQIPVLKTTAITDEGIPELVEMIAAHREHLVSSGELEVRRRARAEARIRDVLDRGLRRAARKRVAGKRLASELDAISDGRETPYSVAAGYLQELVTDSVD